MSKMSKNSDRQFSLIFLRLSSKATLVCNSPLGPALCLCIEALFLLFLSYQEILLGK